jgi:tetratricopeptide (TPR) repeat protein
MITFTADQHENGPSEDGRFAGTPRAQAWLKTEHANLIASVTTAAESGFDRHAWQIPWFLATHLARSGYRNERIPLHRTALAAAVRAGDIVGQAVSSRLLASAYLDLRDPDRALDYYKASADLYGKLGDRLGEAKAWQGLGTIAIVLQGRFTDGAVYIEHELRLQQEIGHKAGEASALISLGMARGILGDIPATLELSRRALALATEIGNQYTEERAWHNIGWCEQAFGHFDEAASVFQHVLNLARRARDRFHEADVFAHLGDLHHAHGKPAEAREAWSEALAIFEEFQHPDADQIRAKLVNPGPLGSPLRSDIPFARITADTGGANCIPWCSSQPVPSYARKSTGDTVQLRRLRV